MPARRRFTLFWVAPLALIFAPLRAQTQSAPATPGGVAGPTAPPSAPVPSGSATGKMLDIHDVQPLLIHFDPVYILYSLLFLLVLGALLLALFYRRCTTPAQRALNAYRQTLERLAAARPLLESGPPEPYAVKVSEIIRSYLESRFAQASTRETTPEFLRRMELSAPAELQLQRESLRTFLEACDLVKFARHEPSRADLARLHDAATEFVTATKPAAVSPTPSPEPAYV